MVTCSKCGVKNPEHAKFCAACGVSLYSLKQGNIRDNTCFGADKRDRDYSGFISFGTFLIIIGIVFAVNNNVFSNLLEWFNQLVNEKVLIRPPETLINSVTLFFGLSGLSNFFVAVIKFIVNRHSKNLLSECLSSVALILFAYLINLFNNNMLRFRMVLGIEIVVCGLFIILYIVLRHIIYKKNGN
jgi:hypothetical protein